MPEERLKLAVFIDFDNIQIGVKDTLGKDFDVSLVLEALKERGELVAKVAYGDWARAGDYSRQMTQHAIQMVQRSVTPRGDKNGADINLALDALEMAFTRHHITAFGIVGGDSDFMALVEKLKQYDKQVFVVGGRSFTSNILQKNCTEFVAYENLLRYGGRTTRAARRGEGGGRGSLEARSLSDALPNILRALKILADRGVAPQLGLLKSTLLQLDSTFSERDYSAGSFLEFMQKVERAGHAHLRRTERGYLVEPAESDGEGEAPAAAESGSENEPPETETAMHGAVENPERASQPVPNPASLELLKQALAAATEKTPGRPLYMRQIRQRMRVLDPDFDERRNGYQGTLDLLRHAQHEGILKIVRDHKGVWRIYSQLPAATPPAPAEAAAEFPATTVLPGAITEPAVNLARPRESRWSETVVALELPESQESSTHTESAESILKAPRAENSTASTQERKGRRPRAVRSQSKGTRRRPTSQRKPPPED
ncbi:MAG: NYN domain-containing protein [Terriglobia bacterium]